MTMTATPTWRPFHDEPLFTDDLLRDVDDIPGAVRATIIAYLEQVAHVRRAPLHTTTAFNALHFGFDLQARGYQAAVLDPELFVRLTTDAATQPALPVGTFVRIERGQQSLWAEVVARFGAADGVHPDGWVPARLSGAPAVLDDTGCRSERVIVDPEAFGAPLTPRERTELHRLRQRGVLLDERGHLTGQVCYPGPRLAGLDDIALYAQHLLTAGKPLLVGGPLGGLLIDPHDDDTLAVALQTALHTIDKLLDVAPHLRRWGGYATPVDRYHHRREDPGLLGGEDLDDLVHTIARSGTGPRFTGVWPWLAGRVDEVFATDPEDVDVDPFELTAAAEAVVHANLAVADHATAAVDGLQPNGVHLRVDDLWQVGGVWLAQPSPVPADLRDVDPLRPLGLGYHQSQPPSQSTDDGTGATDPAEIQQPTDDTEAITGTCMDQREPGPDPGTTDPEPDDTETEGPAGDEVVVEHLDDNIAVYTVALRPIHLDNDTLPVPDRIAAMLADGALVIELHHDGDDLSDDERIHTVEHGDGALTVVAWPLSFYPGIKVMVSLARGARRLAATTTLLERPLPYGDEFRWDADHRLLATALAIDLDPDPAPEETDGTKPDADDEPAPPTVPAKYQGIDPLRRLILAAFRRHGTEGTFGSRRLTGKQLLGVMFGADFDNPPLMWQVIYTCERLVDAGKLTREPNPGRPDKPGSGGPDTFVWWPSQSARQHADYAAAQQRHAALRERTREHWVPPNCRALPSGYRASDQAKENYARHVRRVWGQHADTRLPDGFTFVKGHRRGSDPGPLWLPLT
ncbi:hypothetical protein ACIBXA_05590 [Micromonospora echinaurantiaca]|uniref:hypothetical protein n=1 Tax=Micromonospora echinaurantiaca TaxID=47857 RepID=UPI0037882675